MKIDKHFIVRFGGNDYIDTPNLLTCKGEPVLRVGRDEKSGELDVELDIYDEKGREQAVATQAGLVSGDADAFEVRMTDHRFTVVDLRKERIVCDIRRRAHVKDMDLDVSVLTHTPDGFLVHANPEQSNVRVRSSSEVLTGKDAAINVA
ncbi:MAG TPA: hypothetical protein VFE85_05785 [Woeseiaceae bacterium]|nr:hypothetical protein [Woeseiaceae bacterium]